jgi:Cft2 family RNA processing exonuclease
MAEHAHTYNTIQKMTANAKRIHTKISLPERSDIDATTAKMQVQQQVEHVDCVILSHATISHHSGPSSATAIIKCPYHTHIMFSYGT